MRNTRAIGPYGTLARVIVGAFLLCLAFSDLTVTQFSTPPWHAFALGLVVLPAALLSLQWIRKSFTQEPLNATGPLGYLLVVAVAVTLFSMTLTQEAALIFFGLSLLLAAIRGYAGCEVLAISNWLLHREDQVGCVLLSPLDAIEAQMRRREAH